MFWLLACASPPSLTLPVVPPRAVNATAVPAARFVGPLDIADLDDTALCEAPDLAALVKAGRFGWRVLVLGPDGLRLADDVGEPGSAEEQAARTRARVEQWEAADVAVAARCGGGERPLVLLAVDGRREFDSDTLFRWSGMSEFDVRLLVTDPEPGPPVAPPARGDLDYYLTLGISRSSWAVLASNNEVPPSEHTMAVEAVQRLVQAGYPEAVVTMGPGNSWARLTEGLDAFAGVGVIPSFGLVVSDAPKASAVPVYPPTTGTTLALGDTLAVLNYAFPGYVSRRDKDGKPRRGVVLLQMIGTTGDSSDDAFGGAGEVRDDLFGLPPHVEPPPPAGMLPAP